MFLINSLIIPVTMGASGNSAPMLGERFFLMQPWSRSLQGCCVETYLRRQWRGGTLVLWRSRLWHFSGLIHNTSWPSSPSRARAPSTRWLWTVWRSQRVILGLWNPWQYVPHCRHSWSQRAADGRLTTLMLIQPGQSVPLVTIFPSLL